MHTPAILLFLLAALALPLPSQAQFEPSATAGFAEGYRMDMLQSLVRDATVPKPTRRADAGKQSASSQTMPMRVTYRSSVSARLREEILRESTGDPRSDELLRPVIASGGLLGEYDKLMRHLGLSKSDIADVMTAYLLVSMEAVNGQTPDANERNAVRRAIAGKLAASSQLRALSAEDRQVLAERYAYSTLSTGLTFQVLSRAGRSRDLEAFRTRVRGNVSRATGIDPGRVAATGAGLAVSR